MIFLRGIFFRKKIRHFEIFQTHDKPEISPSIVKTRALTRFGTWREYVATSSALTTGLIFCLFIVYLRQHSIALYRILYVYIIASRHSANLNEK